MRKGILLGAVLLCWATTAPAWVSVGISVPGVSIGFNLPAYPQLVPVPGYPVYYAQNLGANDFYYDGLYWLYQNDIWYSAPWYNGPWGLVDPSAVPDMILQVPVRYYGNPPPYFRGWAYDAAPRWGEHWGRGWEQRRGDWHHGHDHGYPAGGHPAPLPAYQRQYQGKRYPQQMQQQYQLHNQNFHYQPHEPMIREQYQQMRGWQQRGPAGQQHGGGQPHGGGEHHEH